MLGDMSAVLMNIKATVQQPFFLESTLLKSDYWVGVFVMRLSLK